MTDWKNLYREIENKKLLNLYENEEIFVDQFLNVGKKWTFNFCETWVQSLMTALKLVKFYEIIKQYRIAVEKHFNKTKNSSFREMNMINAIFQNQQQNQKTIEKNKNKSKFNQKRHADKQCVCGLIHLFENCSHLIKVKQSTDWIEIKKKNVKIFVKKSIWNQSIVSRLSDTFRIRIFWMIWSKIQLKKKKIKIKSNKDLR